MIWWDVYFEAQRAFKPLPPVPNWDVDLELVCHEFVLYSAYSSEQMSASDIAKYYQKWLKNGRKWAPTLNGYWFSSPTKYVAGKTLPKKGNIVVFDDPSHVALATGETTRAGHSKVVGVMGLR